MRKNPQSLFQRCEKAFKLFILLDSLKPFSHAKKHANPMEKHNGIFRFWWSETTSLLPFSAFQHTRISTSICFYVHFHSDSEITATPILDNPHLILLFYLTQLFLRELVRSYHLLKIIPMDMSGYFGKHIKTDIGENFQCWWGGEGKTIE